MDTIFAPGCKIRFHNPVPVTVDFDSGRIIGKAMIRDDGTATIEVDGKRKDVGNILNERIGFDIVRAENRGSLCRILEVRLWQVSVDSERNDNPVASPFLPGEC